MRFNQLWHALPIAYWWQMELSHAHARCASHRSLTLRILLDAKMYLVMGNGWQRRYRVGACVYTVLIQDIQTGRYKLQAGIGPVYSLRV